MNSEQRFTFRHFRIVFGTFREKLGSFMKVGRGEELIYFSQVVIKFKDETTT